jgi:hypothetical protein
LFDLTTRQSIWLEAYSEPSYQLVVSADRMLKAGANLTDSDVKGVLCRFYI